MKRFHQILNELYDDRATEQHLPEPGEGIDLERSTLVNAEFPTEPPQVAGRMEKAGDYQNISHNTYTQIRYDTTAIEHSDVVSVQLPDNEMRVEADGVYLIQGAIVWDGATDWSGGDAIRLYLMVQREAQKSAEARQFGAHPGFDAMISGFTSFTTELSAGDRVSGTVYLWTANSVSQTVVANTTATFLELIKVG